MTFFNNITQSSTLTIHPSSHGQISVAYTSEMDVKDDGQRPSDRSEDKDVMDTTLDTIHNDSRSVQTQVDTSQASVTGALPATPVIERPRESGDSVQQSSGQMAPLPPKSHLTQNLLSIFGLDPLAATVARKDPVTGEKINKMRKSYEGQLKAFGLAGRNKAIIHDSSKGMGLCEMAAWPEEEWQNQKVSGKDVTKGLSEMLTAKIQKAMQMQPGPIPSNHEWEDILGIEKVKPVEQNTKFVKQMNTTGGKGIGKLNGVRPVPPNTASVEANRPKRRGTKRTYDEHSFEGYGEGYVDDEMDIGGGYTSSETHASRTSRKSGSTTKKRKKDYGNSPTGYAERTTSFSNGTVGASAYGR